MEEIAAKLPPGIGFEWSATSYEERLSGVQAPLLFGISLIVVFLCLAALCGIIRADRLPTVNLGASRNAARTPADLSPTGQAFTSQRYDVTVAVPAFELDFWGWVNRLSESAKASYLASEEAREAFRLSLISDVANAYLILLELHQRIALARATVESRADSRHLLMRRRDVGLAGDLDFLSADGSYEFARADLANLLRNRAETENALTLLVGTMPDKLPAGRRLTEQDIVPDLAVDVPSEALLSRPDVRAAEQKLIAANANIGAARAAFLPRIDISLGFGTASSALSGLFEAGSRAWYFVPSLVQPLFDAGRNRSTLELVEARKVIAVAEDEKTIQQAFRSCCSFFFMLTRIRSDGPAMSSAAMTEPSLAKIGAARALALGTRSPLECAMPSRRIRDISCSRSAEAVIVVAVNRSRGVAFSYFLKRAGSKWASSALPIAVQYRSRRSPTVRRSESDSGSPSCRGRRPGQRPVRARRSRQFLRSPPPTPAG